jgi:uncharacterized protein (UPF0212 family)
MVTYRCSNCFTTYTEGYESCPKCGSSNPHPLFISYEAKVPHPDHYALIEAEIAKADIRERVEKIAKALEEAMEVG